MEGSEGERRRNLKLEVRRRLEPIRQIYGELHVWTLTSFMPLIPTFVYAVGDAGKACHVPLQHGCDERAKREMLYEANVSNSKARFRVVPIKKLEQGNTFFK